MKPLLRGRRAQLLAQLRKSELALPLALLLQKLLIHDTLVVLANPNTRVGACAFERMPHARHIEVLLELHGGVVQERLPGRANTVVATRVQIKIAHELLLAAPHEVSAVMLVTRTRRERLAGPVGTGVQKSTRSRMIQKPAQKLLICAGAAGQGLQHDEDLDDGEKLHLPARRAVKYGFSKWTSKKLVSFFFGLWNYSLCI